MLLSTFTQRQKTFLSYGRRLRMIFLTSMLRESPVCNISSLSVNCPSLPPWSLGSLLQWRFQSGRQEDPRFFLWFDTEFVLLGFFFLFFVVISSLEILFC